MLDVDAVGAALLFDFGMFDLRLRAEDYLEIAADEPFDGIDLDVGTPLGHNTTLREAEFDAKKRIMSTIRLGG